MADSFTNGVVAGMTAASNARKLANKAKGSNGLPAPAAVPSSGAGSTDPNTAGQGFRRGGKVPAKKAAPKKGKR